MYGQEMRWNLPGRKRKVLAFTDMHFCQQVAKKRSGIILQVLQRVCQTEKVDYIFFLGDLINSLDVLSDTILRAELKMFLNALAQMAPVLMVTGNHDMSYYNAGATKGLMYPAEWQRWARALMQNERIHVLDAALGSEQAVFDDGVLRVLGMNLPEVCYPTVVREGCDPVKTFREYAEQTLPELTKVSEREYYLLLHNPQFLSTIEMDPQIAVLAGHMHNGLVPPVMDELLKFTHRGLVGPGYYTRKGKKVSYVPFASGARYRPRDNRLWLTLNSCTHLPPESWLWSLDWVFPALSYVIISEDGPESEFSAKYFWC